MTPLPPPGTAYLSAWYIPRSALENRALAILANEQPVLLWGPRHQGCTWLCHHLAERWQAEDPTRRIAVVDFRSLGSRALAELDDCLQAIAVAIEDGLEDDPDFRPGGDSESGSISDCWATKRGDPKVQLKRFLRRTVLPALPGELLLLFDHADLVHTRPFYEEFAGMLRSWAEKAKLAPGKGRTPWQKLRLLVSVSVHPARLRTRHHESPFANLSDPIQVGDLDRAQIADLARHHDLALSDSDLEGLMRLVGGHPYLARAVLWDLRDGCYTIDDLLRGASLGCSLIADYLQRDQVRLDAAPDLGETFSELVERPDAEVPPEPLDELIRLGLVKQGPNGSHPLRYPLFARLLEERARGDGDGTHDTRPRPTLVYCYAAADDDQARRGRLETHLGLLQRDGYIADWHGYSIPAAVASDRAGASPGGPDAGAAREADFAKLDAADLIVFLVSTEFLASRRIRQEVLPRAVTRHEAGEAVILPVVLHTCDWQQPPFEGIKPLPRAGLPVSLWLDEDDAWADISQEIRRVLRAPRREPTQPGPAETSPDRLDNGHGSARGAIALSPDSAGRCKILFLSADADPASPLAADEEYRRVARRLEATRHRDRVELVPWPDVHAGDLPARLRREQPTIVHFSGHGLADGGLLMRDQSGEATRIDPDVLVGFLGRRRDTIRMVVLNACYSSALADRLGEHIDCVIGMDTDVTDKAAITFAETFYEALFDNEPVQTALADSRDAITAEGGPERSAPHLTTRHGVSPETMRLLA